MIELGGNIKLIGFNDLDPASLIVVKKITGNYARKISEKVNSGLDELSLELKDESGKNINSSVKFKEKTFSAEVNDTNLFYALDRVLAKLLNDAKE